MKNGIFKHTCFSLVLLFMHASYHMVRTRTPCVTGESHEQRGQVSEITYRNTCHIIFDLYYYICSYVVIHRGVNMTYDCVTPRLV